MPGAAHVGVETRPVVPPEPAVSQLRVLLQCPVAVPHQHVETQPDDLPLIGLTELEDGVAAQSAAAQEGPADGRGDGVVRLFEAPDAVLAPVGTMAGIYDSESG